MTRPRITTKLRKLFKRAMRHARTRRLDTSRDRLDRFHTWYSGGKKPPGKLVVWDWFGRR